MSYVAQGAGVLDTLITSADLVKRLAEDPATPKVVSLAQDIYRYERSAGLLQKSDKPVAMPSKGLGLEALVRPLEVYRFTRKNPWVFSVGVALILGVPLVVGYTAGRRRTR